MDQTHRLMVAQTIGGDSEHGLEKRLSGFAAENLVEPRAVSDLGAPLVHRRVDQADIAQLQERAVADVVSSGPRQHGNRVALLEKAAETFARAVPVDEKNEAGTQTSKTFREFGRVR